MSVEIPDKSYFKIGEVSRIVGVEPYNIRYWESQFRAIRPSKTKSNQRLYRRREIELLLRIKGLLYNEGYTIAGAKKRLKELLAEERDGSTPAQKPAAGMADEERRAYDAKLAEAQTEVSDLTARVAQLTSELDEARTEPAVDDDSMQQLGLLTENLEASEVERTRLVERVTALEAEVDGLREAKERAEQLAASHREEAESLAQRAGSSEADADSARTEWESELAAASAATEAAIAERDRLATALDDLETEHGELERAYETLQAQVEGFETSIARLETERDGLIAERDGLIAERDAAAAERDEAKARSERSVHEAEVLRAELAGAREGNASRKALEDERATLAGRIEAMAVETTRLKRALDAAQIAVEQKDARRIALAASIRAELAPILRIGQD